MRPTRTHLSELHEKYKSLSELRRQTSDAPKARLRALSERFPGALRELDILPIELLEERREQSERAAVSGELPEWLVWMHAYHATMRAALKVKARLAKTKVPSREDAEHLASWLNQEMRVSYDADFVASVARPPAGRLNLLVMHRLACHFEVSPETLATTLFPGRPARAW